MTDSDESDGILPLKRRSYIQTLAVSAAATGTARADSHGYGAGGYGEGAYGTSQPDDDGPRRRTSSTRSSSDDDGPRRRTSSTRSSN